MKFFDRLLGRTKARSNPLPGLVWTPAGWVNNQLDIKGVLKDAYSVNSTVYSIITTMQKKFASIAWIMYKVNDGQKAMRYKTLSSSYNPAPATLLELIKLKASAFDEVSDHKALQLFNQPSENQTGQEFREELLMFLKLMGAGCVWANTGSTGIEPLEMHVLPSQFIRLQATTDLTSFEKVFYTITGQQAEIPKEQFLYWSYPNPNYSATGSHIYGLSPLKAASTVVGADNELMESVGFVFENKGATGVFSPKDKDAMVQAAKQTDQLKKIIDETANGRDYGKTRTLVNFPLDYHTFGFTAVESETIAMAGLNTEKLCGIFNFPPYLAMMAKGTDSKYTEAVKYMITNTLYSDLTSMRDWVNNWFLGLFGLKGKYYFDFDISALPEMQEDMQKLVNSLKEMFWLTLNERRLVSKYDALADPLMNEILIPTNLQPLKAAFDAGTNIDPDLL